MSASLYVPNLYPPPPVTTDISGGDGGSGEQQVFSGNYGGGTPTDTPTADEAIAIDKDTGAEWHWFDGAWHD